MESKFIRIYYNVYLIIYKKNIDLNPNTKQDFFKITFLES